MILRTEWLKIGSIVFVVVFIITLILVFTEGKKKDSINAYDVALTALRNNSPEALDLLEKVAIDYRSSNNAADALIKLGNSYFNQKDFDSSEKFYAQYIDKYGDDPIYTFNAYNGIGAIYEERGDYQKAGEMYEKFISKNNNSVFLPMMYLNAGKAYFYSGDKNAAKRNFIKITENFTDSEEKQEAHYFLELLD